jgi:hypothetical protein
VRTKPVGKGEPSSTRSASTTPRIRRWLQAPRDRVYAAVWLILSTALVATVCSTHFPPFYDYYQWRFQGHVVSVLLFGSEPESAGLAGAYSLSPVPVPNLAAPVAIGALDTVLPSAAAGRLFTVLTVLGFAAAFGALVRAVQQRPTAVEFIGFLWAPGFFLYKGYLSYLFGLALTFLLVTVLHRGVARPAGPTRTTLWSVCVLGAVLYLSHLLAWGIGVLAVLVYALVLSRRGQRSSAAWLPVTVLPGVVMALWYVLAERGGSGITLYDTWLEKAIALTETLQFFLRVDPFPPVFPIFWVNLLVSLAVAALVLRLVDRSALRSALATRPVLWLAGLLAVIALLLPISMINGLIKPDERFVLPALLLAAAAVPYRTFRVPATATAATALLVVAVLGLHVAEYTDVGPRIGRVDAATDASVPDGAPVLYIAIPSRHGCAPSSGPSIGVPTLKWFGTDYALDNDQPRVNIDETSFVDARDAGHPGMTVLARPAAEVPATVLPVAPAYPYLQAVGCPADLTTIEHSLAPAYSRMTRGEGYSIFRRKPSAS